MTNLNNKNFKQGNYKESPSDNEKSKSSYSYCIEQSEVGQKGGKHSYSKPNKNNPNKEDRQSSK